MKINLDKYDAFIFDLDGTIYIDNNLIMGAKSVVDYLVSRNKKIIFISNKTTGSALEYYNFLNSRNLSIRRKQIITSTEVIKKYLIDNHRHENFYAIGEKRFIDEIESCGLTFCSNAGDINIVIITLDRTFNFEKLEITAKALENGAHFFAANIDATCPVGGGEIWDAGSTILALEKRTHRKLEKHFGKPSGFMVNEIQSRLKTKFEKCLIIGDRLETDIAMGNDFGIETVLVKTGVIKYLNGNTKIKPTFTINSIADLSN